MKPKKHLIARAEANGSLARLNQLLSAPTSSSARPTGCSKKPQT